MALSKWRLKQLWMYPFMRTRAGADLYEWLTAGVLGIIEFGAPEHEDVFCLVDKNFPVKAFEL